jgi:arylsulfatase A-like enzyme
MTFFSYPEILMPFKISRRQLLKLRDKLPPPRLLFLFILLLGSACQTKEEIKETVPQNILFIAVDDLRPELSFYGNRQIISPHLAELAAGGFVFERAYCNVPVCGASRASLLTGLRPKPDRFLDFATYASEDAPQAVTLPQHFRQHGYYTLSLGKMFHHQDDKPESWSEPAWHPQQDLPVGSASLDYQLPENAAYMQDEDPERGPPFEQATVPDSAYFDGKIAAKAQEKLRQLATADQPFFLAVGFLKPHLPFNAPSRYWELYNADSIRLPERMELPQDAPRQANHNFGELRHYRGIPDEGPVPDALARRLIHGYYASVSYVDAMIGQVLAELERLELAENTIVIVWGDHGWSLGDHGLWCKHSTFNVAMRAPLIIRAPGRSGGPHIHALTEFVDIYPSLCELADLPKPEHLQGDSFVPLLDDPLSVGKTALFCRWQRSDAIKTDQYLYTEWFDQRDSSLARMLYDHSTDPEETINIAEREENKERVAAFGEALRRQRGIE